MATFIELRTDAFAENLKEFERSKLSFDGVRRPLRGIEIKDDTYAVIKVIKSDGTDVALLDSSRAPPPSGNETAAGSGIPSQIARNKGNTYNYSNFIIQTVVDSRQEKQQIIETFGDSYIFFFGERPRIIQVQGLLFNTHDFNWRTEFWHNYENTLRGTKLVEQNARMYLHWDDIVVEGYVLGAQAQDDASMPYHIPFSFSMFVTNHIYLNSTSDDDFPIRNTAYVEPLRAATDFKAFYDLAAGKAGAENDAVRAQLQNALDIENAAFGQRQPLKATAEDALTALEAASKPSKFNVGKNLIANAVAIGIQTQRLTFLSLANRFFNQRKIKFPRGIAGADTGKPTVSGVSNEAGSKRTLKLRSKIWNNTDEYVTGGGGPQAASDTQKKAQQRQEKLATKPDLENNALSILSSLGIDPIQHGKPETANIFTRGYNIVTASTEHEAGELNAFDSAFVENASNLGFR